MRRTMALLTVLLAAMLAVAGALPWGMPTETLVPGPAGQVDGSVQVAENGMLVSRVYTLRDGSVTQVYEELRIRDGVERAVVRVASEGADTYFLRAYENGTDWELMRLENNEAVSVHQGNFENEGTVTGLAAQAGTVWITAVGADGTICVYEYEKDAGAALKMLLPNSWLAGVVTAEYDGQRVRATTEYGDHCFLTVNGEKTYTDEAAEAPLPAIKLSTAGWLLCKKSVLIAAVILWLVIALSVLIAARVIRRADRLATRLTAAGSEVIFLMLLLAVGAVSWQLLCVAGLGKMAQALGILAIAAAVIWLLGLLLLRLVSGSITKPVAALTKQMDEIADGHIDFREVSPGRDELHRMDQSMQEMCMSLSIRNYELESTIRSYGRFVPEKLTQLLDRASVAEVDLGDNRRLMSNVGLFSVGNRAEARNVLEDDAFVDFINYSFGIFRNCIQENHGNMISSGLRLSAMETMFPESAADGVRAGLDFLGQTQKKPAENIPAPQPFLMLHRTSFLYGVAGQEERLFPYLSSGELEFLGSFAPRFHQTGVRIVMTEAYWKQLECCGYNARYIGFVTDGERGAYKLYEVLDAYPELEKKLRMGYDQRFQEAINLFYHNDFFLARNLLSSLLRVCPEDGIVRWYLFACEHYFNQEGEYEANYQLFGIDEV